MDKFEEMRVFRAVVENRSFSGAAHAVGIAQPTVSKYVTALEARLDVRLIHRSSRKFSLTEAGRSYYDDVVRIMDDLEATETRAGRDQTVPRGTLRVTMSPGFGRLHVVPTLGEFFRRYPKVELELDITDRHVDLIEEKMDVAIRIGRLPDSSLVTRQLAVCRNVFVASAQYLDRRGVPRSPSDVFDHACVAFVMRGRPVEFSFLAGSKLTSLRPAGPFATTDCEHVLAGALAGLGIAQGPDWLFRDAIARGELVRILAEFAPEGFPVHAVMAGKPQPAKVRVFVDHVARSLLATGGGP